MSSVHFDAYRPSAPVTMMPAEMNQTQPLGSKHADHPSSACPFQLFQAHLALDKSLGKAAAEEPASHHHTDYADDDQRPVLRPEK
jgi:hypothetical protein